MYAFIYGVSSFFFIFGVLAIINGKMPPVSNQDKENARTGGGMMIISLIVIIATTIGRYAG